METIRQRLLPPQFLPFGVVYRDGGKVTVDSGVDFKLALDGDELRQIVGKKGVLRVEVLGLSFYYQQFAVVPLDSRKWVSARGVKIAVIEPDEKMKVVNNSIVDLMFFGSDRHWDYKFALLDAKGQVAFPLNAQISNYQYTTGGTLMTEFRQLGFVNEAKPELLKSGQVLIYLPIFDNGKMVKGAFEIKDFCYTKPN